VADQLAIRISADIRRSRTSSRIINRAVAVDPNRDDFELLRVKLSARPTALPGARLDLTYSTGRSQMPQFEGIEPPYRIRRNPNATYGVFAISTDSLTGRFVYEPASNAELRAKFSVGQATIRRHPTPGLGDVAIAAKDFTIEPIVAWRWPAGPTLIGGLHYTRSTLDQTIDLSTFPPVLGNGAFSDVQNSLGLFAEGSLALGGNI
jgi:iron complex outermembrane receptor protein